MGGLNAESGNKEGGEQVFGIGQSGVGPSARGGTEGGDVVITESVFMCGGSATHPTYCSKTFRA
ncbi:MAG: hypothetical protein SVT56_04130 [Chloroflexota bacterium]|nr:hypothetical protein [Chloroflexota bacterium]